MNPNIPQSLQEHLRAWAFGLPQIRENHALMLLQAADRLDILVEWERWTQGHVWIRNEEYAELCAIKRAYGPRPLPSSTGEKS